MKRSMFRCVACRITLLEEGPRSLRCPSCGKREDFPGDFEFLKASPDCRIGELDNIVNQHEFASRLRKRSGTVNDVATWHGIKVTEEHTALLKPYLRGAVIVDMGCGQVPLINQFAGQGVRSYYAVDALKDLFERSRPYINVDFDCEFVLSDVTNCHIADNSADIVLSSLVLEHVERPHDYLSEMYRILKPGGVLSLSTPCGSIYFHPYELSNLFRGPASRRQWLKRVNCEDHWEEMIAWHPALRPAALGSWLEKSGFDIQHHVSRGCYLGTCMRPVFNFCAGLERIGLDGAATLRGHIALRECLIRSGLPLLRWMGFIQFALSVKRSP